MAARGLVLLLIALLALPAAVVTPPTRARPASGVVAPESAPEAAKRKKKKSKKPKTVARTVRQTVTRTFASEEMVEAPAIGGSGRGEGTPYPARIAVDGLVNGVIQDVNVVLRRFGHENPDDLDVLLQLSTQPTRNALIMSDVGGEDLAWYRTLTLDDEAAAPLPDEDRLETGSYQPTNATGEDGVDGFFFGPVPSGHTFLNVFDQGDPNGEWRLYVSDDAQDNIGYFDGWALQITAEVDVQVEERVKQGKDRR